MNLTNMNSSMWMAGASKAHAEPARVQEAAGKAAGVGTLQEVAASARHAPHHVDTCCFHPLCLVTDSTRASRVRKSSSSDRGANSRSTRGVGAFSARLFCFLDPSRALLGVATLDGGGALLDGQSPVALGLASGSPLLSSPAPTVARAVDLLRSPLLLLRCMKCGVTRRNLPWAHILSAAPAQSGRSLALSVPREVSSFIFYAETGVAQRNQGKGPFFTTSAGIAILRR